MGLTHTGPQYACVQTHTGRRTRLLGRLRIRICEFAARLRRTADPLGPPAAIGTHAYWTPACVCTDAYWSPVCVCTYAVLRTYVRILEPSMRTHRDGSKHPLKNASTPTSRAVEGAVARFGVSVAPCCKPSPRARLGGHDDLASVASGGPARGRPGAPKGEHLGAPWRAHARILEPSMRTYVRSTACVQTHTGDQYASVQTHTGRRTRLLGRLRIRICEFAARLRRTADPLGPPAAQLGRLRIRICEFAARLRRTADPLGPPAT